MSFSEKAPSAGIVSVTSPQGVITLSCFFCLHEESKININTIYMNIFCTIGHKITTLFANMSKKA